MQALRAIEDRAIRDAVARQEAIGLACVTDGEFRRETWHLDFLSQLEGVTTKVVPGPTFRGIEEPPPIAPGVRHIRCTVIRGSQA